jgi:hypothetical protein
MEKKQTNGKNVGEGSATVNPVTISGESYSPLSEEVKINLGGGAAFTDISEDDDLTGWFNDNNLPSGLSAKPKNDVSSGDTTITIIVSGTPTKGSGLDLAITVPGDALAERGADDIPVDPNPAALYDITAVIKCVCDLQNFANAVNEGDVKQNAKLESSATKITVPSGEDYIPISRDYAHAYEGDFDGSGGKIKICLSDDEGFLALFGINKGTIHDLTVCGSVTLNENAGNKDYIAGVVAYKDRKSVV